MFNNAEIERKYYNIFHDKNFSLKKYGFRRVVFEAILNSHGNIQLKTAEKMTKAYNDYYKSKEVIETLFNLTKIMNNTTKGRVIEWRFWDTKEPLYGLIDAVLSF